MTRSSVDLPQPDGPMSETNSPGAMSRSMPLSATVLAPLAGREHLVDAADADDRAAPGWLAAAPGAWRRLGHASTPGRPRSTMISATRITRKNAIPSTPATKIAAHSFSGPVE